MNIINIIKCTTSDKAAERSFIAWGGGISILTGDDTVGNVVGERHGLKRRK